MERTLVLLKPDAVQRGLIGTILSRFEARGLKIAALKLIRISRALAEQHYAVHKGKDFYELLLAFITAAPAVALVLEGASAISVARAMAGPTSALLAPPGTIRGDLGLSQRYNLVHCSDSPASAGQEIALFFGPTELLEYDRPGSAWA